MNPVGQIGGDTTVFDAIYVVSQTVTVLLYVVIVGGVILYDFCCGYHIIIMWTVMSSIFLFNFI